MSTEKIFFSDLEKEEIIKFAANGFNNLEIAHMMGVSEKTFYRKLNENREFKGKVARAKILADSEIITSVRQSATGYSHPETIYKVVAQGGDNGSAVEAIETVKHYPPNFQAARLLLMNRQPKMFRDKQELDVSISSIPDTDLEKLAIEAMLKDPDMMEKIKSQLENEDGE